MPSPKLPTETKIVLAHGGGGEMTQRLVAEHFLPKLGNPLLNPLTDSALLDVETGRVAVTTDGYVVQPLEFPGGDIGRLAVCGTVNDLAVMGAEPKVLALSVIIEEGLELERLDRIIDSMAAAAKEANVAIGTGDTKVVESRRGDGMTITTAGVGVMRKGLDLGMHRIDSGDVLLINGPIAEHGLAVMSAREGLSFETDLRSDVAPLNGLIAALLDADLDIKFMRDATRSGLAGIAADLCETTKLGIELDESAIPLTRVAHHTAELLGLDPLTVANEGKVVVVVPAARAESAISVMKRHPRGRNAMMIGRCSESDVPLVELITRAGGRRIVQRPYGEELPRIC